MKLWDKFWLHLGESERIRKGYRKDAPRVVDTDPPESD